MIKKTTLTLMLFLGLGFMAQAAVPSTGVALYKHNENGSRVTQGFIDPKVAMDRRPESAPREKSTSEATCEIDPINCKKNVITQELK